MTAIKDLHKYEHIFLLNENSGTFKLRKKAMKAIEHFCMHDRVHSEMIYMKDVEESRRIIGYLNEKPGEKIFYSIGGDGTLSSIINFLGEGQHQKFTNSKIGRASCRERV